jgi:hypothetical protein
MDHRVIELDQPDAHRVEDQAVGDRTPLLETDHVHPWSRGGWTHVSNGQILCKRHNREKRASIPFGWQLRGLAKRRAAYYPPGQPVTVTRHRPAVLRRQVKQQ